MMNSSYNFNMMNPMYNNNMMMGQINPMDNPMNNNMMMNPMTNNNMMMNPMMNSGMMMNPMMNQINNNNNIEKRKINNPNNLDIYYELNYYTSISRDILSEKDDINIIRSKLISVYLQQKKKLYRPPYPEEIIERESPKETLEFLLNRGVMEKEPRIEFFVHPNSKFGFFGWNNITVIMDLIKKKN